MDRGSLRPSRQQRQQEEASPPAASRSSQRQSSPASADPTFTTPDQLAEAFAHVQQLLDVPSTNQNAALLHAHLDALTEALLKVCDYDLPHALASNLAAFCMDIARPAILDLTLPPLPSSPSSPSAPATPKPGLGAALGRVKEPDKMQRVKGTVKERLKLAMASAQCLGVALLARPPLQGGAVKIVRDLVAAVEACFSRGSSARSSGRMDKPLPGASSSALGGLGVSTSAPASSSSSRTKPEKTKESVMDEDTTCTLQHLLQVVFAVSYKYGDMLGNEEWAAVVDVTMKVCVDVRESPSVNEVLVAVSILDTINEQQAEGLITRVLEDGELFARWFKSVFPLLLLQDDAFEESESMVMSYAGSQMLFSSEAEAAGECSWAAVAKPLLKLVRDNKRGLDEFVKRDEARDATFVKKIVDGLPTLEQRANTAKEAICGTDRRVQVAHEVARTYKLVVQTVEVVVALGQVLPVQGFLNRAMKVLQATLSMHQFHPELGMLASSVASVSKLAQVSIGSRGRYSSKLVAWFAKPLLYASAGSLITADADALVDAWAALASSVVTRTLSKGVWRAKTASIVDALVSNIAHGVLLLGHGHATQRVRLLRTLGRLLDLEATGFAAVRDEAVFGRLLPALVLFMWALLDTPHVEADSSLYRLWLTFVQRLPGAPAAGQSVFNVPAPLRLRGGMSRVHGETLTATQQRVAQLLAENPDPLSLTMALLVDCAWHGLPARSKLVHGTLEMFSARQWLARPVQVSFGSDVLAALGRAVESLDVSSSPSTVLAVLWCALAPSSAGDEEEACVRACVAVHSRGGTGCRRRLACIAQVATAVRHLVKDKVCSWKRAGSVFAALAGTLADDAKQPEDASLREPEQRSSSIGDNSRAPEGLSYVTPSWHAAFTSCLSLGLEVIDHCDDVECGGHMKALADAYVDAVARSSSTTWHADFALWLKERAGVERDEVGDLAVHLGLVLLSAGRVPATRSASQQARMLLTRHMLVSAAHLYSAPMRRLPTAAPSSDLLASVGQLVADDSVVRSLLDNSSTEARTVVAEVVCVFGPASRVLVSMQSASTDLSALAAALVQCTTAFFDSIADRLALPPVSSIKHPALDTSNELKPESAQLHAVTMLLCLTPVLTAFVSSSLPAGASDSFKMITRRVLGAVLGTDWSARLNGMLSEPAALLQRPACFGSTTLGDFVMAVYTVPPGPVRRSGVQLANSLYTFLMRSGDPAPGTALDQALQIVRSASVGADLQPSSKSTANPLTARKKRPIQALMSATPAPAKPNKKAKKQQAVESAAKPTARRFGRARFRDTEFKKVDVPVASSRSAPQTESQLRRRRDRSVTTYTSIDFSQDLVTQLGAPKRKTVSPPPSSLGRKRAKADDEDGDVTMEIVPAVVEAADDVQMEAEVEDVDMDVDKLGTEDLAMMAPSQLREVMQRVAARSSEVLAQLGRLNALQQEAARLLSERQ